MRVGIIGPGALGCLLAARFSLAGIQVCLVDYLHHRAAALRRQGILLRSPGGAVEAVPVPVELAGRLAPVDLAVLTVKAHQTATAAASLPSLLAPEGIVLTLQNGLGNLEALAGAVGWERLLAGVSILGVTRLRDGEVVLAGSGPTYVGAPPRSRVPPGQVNAVVHLFHRAGLPCEARDKIEALLWEKLLVNVGINPLTALLRVRNGQLPEIPPAWEVAVAAAAEALAVAQAQGLALALDPERRLREVCTATAANRSSMLQDVLAGRPTEIEALNAQVAARGAALGIPTPVNTLLSNLVRALETLPQDTLQEL